MKKCYFIILFAVFTLLFISFSYADTRSMPSVLLSGDPAFFNYSKESLVFGAEEGIPTETDVVEVDDNIVQIGDIPILNLDDLTKAYSYYDGQTVDVKTLVNSKIVVESRLIDNTRFDSEMYGLSAITCGTISFYLPDMQVGFALGHPISNGKIYGSVIKAKVTGHDDDSLLMNKEKNNKGNIVFGQIEFQNNYGVVLSYDSERTSTKKLKTIQIAQKDEVKLGPAYIYTDFGKGKKMYEINIIALDGYDYRETSPVYNDLITFAITDKRLVSKNLDCIFIGMSGSPIIQNDKLIGITGYGNELYSYAVYAETAFESVIEYYNENVSDLPISSTTNNPVVYSTSFDISIYAKSHGYLVSGIESSKDIKLQNGDIIIAINDKGLFSNNDINYLVAKYKNKRKNDCKFTVIRDGKIIDVFVSKRTTFSVDSYDAREPIHCFVSMIEPNTKKFYAESIDDNMEFTPYSGLVMKYNTKDVIGSIISRNKQVCGYFDNLNFSENQLIEIAFKEEVTDGNAYITCLDNQKISVIIKKYDDHIEFKIDENSPSVFRSFENIPYTGMPIIQNGKMIGVYKKVKSNDTGIGYYAIDVYNNMMSSK
ncbi:MAG: hypothetical protein IKR04_06600 [Clostridia bacterium]|nr:hypothetical protein [Clostridia bacterium]